VVTVFEGGVAETTAVLKERFDHIMYTGSTPVGKVVMRAAAEYLTPVTLELGGKRFATIKYTIPKKPGRSPAIIGDDTDMHLTARRLVWGKFVNCGQTCIAPDYIICTGGKEQERILIDELRICINEFYGEKVADAKDYARIINERHFE
jgi:acyl-CoA reductase-like NAD-dependent aldehyde dehydrogenase